MITVISTLGPIFFLVVLGETLVRRHWFRAGFFEELSRLVYWVALPALILQSIASGGHEWRPVLPLIFSMVGATFVVLLLGILISRGMGLSMPVTGSLVQGGFRGNLAFVGVPVVMYSFGGASSPTAHQWVTSVVMVMAPIMILYNVLAVLTFMVANHRGTTGLVSRIGGELVRNPLIIASAMGLILGASEVKLPVLLGRSLDLLGQMAVPGALLAVGASLAANSIKGNWKPLTAVAILKTVVTPLVALGIGWAFGLDSERLRILLILAACPTAAASYPMARQMGGDEAVAAGSIVASTLACFPALAVILALT